MVTTRFRRIPRGTGVTLRALPDGDPIYLADKLFSHSAPRLEVFCGRLLRDDTTPQLLTQTGDEATWLDTPNVIGDLTPREAATSPDPTVRAELRSMIDDIEATLLQAQRAGQPTSA